MRRTRRALGAAWAAAWLLAASSAAGGDAPIPAAEAPRGTEAPPAPPDATSGEAPDASADAGGCAVPVAERVQRYYDGVADLAGDFEQTTRSAAFGSAGFDAPSAGRVEFAKPGRMRWTYREPAPSEVVSDGSTLWIYDPAAKEVQVLEVGEAFLSAAALQFMLGEGRILESFRVRAQACDAPRVTLRLVPKQEATYEWLELEVEAADGAIAVTRVQDILGNLTEVRFENVRTNQAPPASRFRFETPDGVKELRLPSS